MRLCSWYIHREREREREARVQVVNMRTQVHLTCQKNIGHGKIKKSTFSIKMLMFGHVVYWVDLGLWNRSSYYKPPVHSGLNPV